MDTPSATQHAERPQTSPPGAGWELRAGRYGWSVGVWLACPRSGSPLAGGFFHIVRARSLAGSLPHPKTRRGLPTVEVSQAVSCARESARRAYQPLPPPARHREPARVRTDADSEPHPRKTGQRPCHVDPVRERPRGDRIGTSSMLWCRSPHSHDDAPRRRGLLASVRLLGGFFLGGEEETPLSRGKSSLEMAPAEAGTVSESVARSPRIQR